MPYITNTKELRKAVRQGPYAWPGGYPIFFGTDDGDTLAYDTVKANYRKILHSVKYKHNDGWRVVGYDINWEDDEMIDAHTNEKIESAYGDHVTMGELHDRQTTRQNEGD